MVKKRKILLISPTPTHPAIAGNRARVEALLSSMRAIGHDVYFLHVQSEHGDEDQMRRLWGENFHSVPYSRPEHLSERVTRKLRMLVNPEARYLYSIDEWYDPSLDRVLVDLQKKHKFDTVMVEYVFFSRALECFGDEVLKIIDTHDMFTDRHRHYLNRGQQPQWYSTSAREEARGLNRADVVIAIQDKERESFSRLTRKKVITVGHLVPLHELRADRAIPGRMLFVGSDNPVNVAGIQYFIREVLPKVREKVQDAALAVAGTVCRAIEDGPGILRLGMMDDLQPAYDAAHIVINPVFISTGLSIKNLEALGQSKPLVTSPGGADGISDGIGSAFLVAQTPDELSALIVSLLTQAEMAAQLSKRAYEYASRRNTQAVDQLESVLGERASPARAVPVV